MKKEQIKHLPIIESKGKAKLLEIVEMAEFSVLKHPGTELFYVAGISKDKKTIFARNFKNRQYSNKISPDEIKLDDITDYKILKYAD